MQVLRLVACFSQKQDKDEACHVHDCLVLQVPAMDQPERRVPADHLARLHLLRDHPHEVLPGSKMPNHI